MNELAWPLLVLTGIAAVANWVSVGIGSRLLEWGTKPSTTIGLAFVALAIDPVDSTARAWFVVALVLSLCGDVALLIEHDRPGPTWFVAGLGSFLLAHVAYVIGLTQLDLAAGGLFLGAFLMGALLATVGRRIIRGAAETDPTLRVPVLAYMAVISAMVATAFAAGDALGAAGALTFAFSDSMIAWNRFVEPFAAAGVAIMVTYHLGQLGLVLSLT